MDVEPPQDIAIDPDRLHARAAVYRLLGRLWLREVDGQLWDELNSPPLKESFVAAGGVLPDAPVGAPPLEELAIDYCQLFLGPREHLPPHQSVWSDGQFHGASTAAIQAEYQALNLPPPSGMVDHLGDQLTAMAVIIERLATRQQVPAGELDAAQQFFSRRLAWTSELCRQAVEHAQSAFYRSVVAMTQDFLREEHDAWLDSGSER